MKSFPWKVFFGVMFAIALILFCLPINLFNGAIVYQQGAQEVLVEAPLSLSYFVGLGYQADEMDYVKSFYLHPSGIILACAFLLIIPTLIAVRVQIHKKQKMHEK